MTIFHINQNTQDFSKVDQMTLIVKYLETGFVSKTNNDRNSWDFFKKLKCFWNGDRNIVKH